jgi:hypothetical protein
MLAADMKLIDIGFHPGPGVEAPLHRTAHIHDALRRELVVLDVDAPFRKLAVALTTTAREWCWDAPVFGVVEVTGRIDDGVLTGPYDAMKDGVLGATAQAVRRASATLRWPADSVLAMVESLHGRSPLHHYELEPLGKVHRRSGRRVRVFFGLTEADSTVSVSVEHEGRVLADMVVAHGNTPLPLGLWWPVAKSALDGDDFVLRDRKGAELARVHLMTGSTRE